MEHRHHGGGTPPGLHHAIFSLSVLPACPDLGCDCAPHRELFYVWPLQVCRSAILRTLQKVQRVGRQTRVLQVRFSASLTSFSNTFLKVLLSLLRMANVGCRLDQCLSGKLRYSNSSEKVARKRSGLGMDWIINQPRAGDDQTY